MYIIGTMFSTIVVWVKSMMTSAPGLKIAHKIFMHNNVHATKFDFEWIQNPHAKQMGFKAYHISWGNIKNITPTIAESSQLNLITLIQGLWPWFS